MLARIARDDTVVVQILVDQRQRDRVSEGQRVRVRIPGHRSPDTYARVAHIEPTHRPMARQQIFIVRALLPNSTNPLESGMRGQARIMGPREPLLKVWLRDLVRALRRDAWPV